MLTRNEGRFKDASTKSTLTRFTKPTVKKAIKLKVKGKYYLYRKKGYRVKDYDKAKPKNDVTVINAVIKRLYK